MSLNRSLFARDMFASSNAPVGMLPLLQQGGLPLSLGNGFSGLQQQNDLNSLLNGLVPPRTQAMPDPLYFQQANFQQQNFQQQNFQQANYPQANFQQANFGAPQGGAFLGQSGGIPAAPMTLPASTLTNLGAHVSNLRGGSGQRPPPTQQEVQDALATIAAAAAPGSNVAPLFEVEKILPGGHPPVIVYMDCDEESLSDYQCLLRKQIELFEA
jgi:hypothetical protein